jgi:hypothetical protein
MTEARIAHSKEYEPNVSRSASVSGMSPKSATASRGAPVARSDSSGACGAARKSSAKTLPTIAV